jgi:hypothetical protein
MDAAAALDDRCPRCGGPFHCGVSDTGGCACFGLSLSAGLIARLRADYSSCLCIACLKTLQDAESPEAPAARA